MIVQWIRVSGLHRSFANLVQCTKRLDEIAELPAHMAMVPGGAAAARLRRTAAPSSTSPAALTELFGQT